MRKSWLSILVCGWALVATAREVKYVFFMIGDGMGVQERMTAEDVSLAEGTGPLRMNHLDHQALTRTRSASNPITDSAAAATALACGIKTYNGAIGVDTSTNRVESMAEYAHRRGRKVGIVTTVTICHATPAGFYAHRPSRRQTYSIGLDLVASGFEYFAGGGFGSTFDDRRCPDYRGNLYDLAAAAGYTVLRGDAQGTAAFRALKAGEAGKVLFAAADEYMPYAIDRAEGEPTLAELTAKGIELLDGPAGFFMMVEGGKIDFAGHNNDAATNVRETLDFDRAVTVALDFARAHPDETLVVVTADHETGGMAMGYSKTGYSLYLDRLARQHGSAEEFVNALQTHRRAHGADFETAKPLFRRTFGFAFPGETESAETLTITAAEEDRLRTAYRSEKPQEWLIPATRVFASQAGIGWTSNAHTAAPVLTTATGVNAERIVTTRENTELSDLIRSAL